MPRLLLADDDDANRLTLAALLEDEGFVIEAVGSAREARELLQQAHPRAFDLVVLDQTSVTAKGPTSCRSSASSCPA